MHICACAYAGVCVGFEFVRVCECVSERFLVCVRSCVISRARVFLRASACADERACLRLCLRKSLRSGVPSCLLSCILVRVRAWVCACVCVRKCVYTCVRECVRVTVRTYKCACEQTSVRV